MLTNDSEFEIWFRARLLDVTGVDLGTPSGAAPPAVLVDWHRLTPATRWCPPVDEDAAELPI